MTTAQGAVAPYQSGQVAGYVDPSHLVKPHSTAIADFVRVLKDILGHVQVYHNEADLLAAHSALDAFSHHMIDPADRMHVKQEWDAAPVEDVSQRQVPNIGAPQMPVQGFGPIDYNKLAAALVLAQQAASQAAAAPVVVHDITDAQATGAPAASQDTPPDMGSMG